MNIPMEQVYADNIDRSKTLLPNQLRIAKRAYRAYLDATANPCPNDTHVNESNAVKEKFGRCTHLGTFNECFAMLTTII